MTRKAYYTRRSLFLLVLLALPLAGLSQANYSNPYTFATIAGKASVSGTNDGTGTAALFDFPDGLAVDGAGNLFIVDQYNFTIRKMTPAGTATTLAGQPGVAGSTDGTNNYATFNHPWGLAMDQAGNLFVADQGNHTIRKMTPVGTNWVVTTIAGKADTAGSADGTNDAARFNWPDGVAVDPNGNVYVADHGDHTIRKLAPLGTNWVVTTIAGLATVYGADDGTNSAARFNKPSGVTVDNAGVLYVADLENDTIRRLRPVGTNWVVTTIAGQAGISGSKDGTNNTALFNQPNGVTWDTAGNLFVIDYGNYTIRMLTPVETNWVVTTLGGLAGTAGSTNGTGSAARFNHPTFAAIDGAGDLYVSDRDNDLIKRGFLANGAPVILTSPPGFLSSKDVFTFNLMAAAGQQVVVDASTDLMSWVPIATNTVGPGVLIVNDPQSQQYPRRFYRAHGP
jgi:secreted PhoX family phosphatase